MRAAKKALVQLSGPLAAPVLAEDFPHRHAKLGNHQVARQTALDLERPPKNPRRPRNPALAQSRKSTVFPFSDFSGLRINHGERLLSCNRRIGP
jgi:hypothetical protein